MPDKKAMMLAIGIGKPSDVSFDVPEGIDLSDIKDGQEKEVVAVIRKEEGGARAILVSINGIALAEESPEEEVIEEEVEETPEEKPMSIRDRAASVGLM
jgi:hypothetical protein